jgi:hypothetical protein
MDQDLRIFTITLATAAAILLHGCGRGEGQSLPQEPIVQEPPVTTGLWTRGRTGNALLRFSDAVSEIVADSELVAAPGQPQEPLSPSHTGTYTVEADIDEYDVLKYNGEILAVVADACCGYLPPVTIGSALLPPPDSNARIALYRTEPATGSARFIGDLPTPPTMPTDGLYLTADSLVVLGTTTYWGGYGDPLALPGPWQGQETIVSAWRLSESGGAELPVSSGTLSIEGALLLSRRRGDDIYLITRHTPAIEGLTYAPQTAEQVANNEQVLSQIDVGALQPSLSWNGNPIPSIDPDTCWVSETENVDAPASTRNVSMTLLMRLDAATAQVESMDCVLDPITGVSISEDAFIFTLVESSESGQSTLVHSLALDDWRYRGSAKLKGRLYTGGNDDFRLSQYNGVIRLVTTELMDDENDRFDHRLYTLRAVADEPKIDVLATLPRAGEPELGKPNEDLYGVRFLDDRLYLVTYEITDPLYVIDLADAEQPRSAGTLELPGFSDLLHPVGDQLLLGVGESPDGRAKVALFDVGDIGEPSLLDSIEIGSDFEGSHSPAQHNRYAFTYLIGEAADRIALPASAWRTVDVGFDAAATLEMFELSNQSTPGQAILAPVGKIEFTDATAVSDRTRSVIDGNALYVATHQGLFAGFWSNPATVQPVPREVTQNL